MNDAPKPEKRKEEKPPPEPTIDEAAQDTELDLSRRLKRRGRASTILTSEMGLGGNLGAAGTPRATGAKLLLGQGA